MDNRALEQPLLAQLQESEERFKLLSEASFDGVVIHEGGKVVLANQVLAAMFGYDLEEFQHLSYQELIAPEDWPLIVEKISRGDTTPYEVVAVRKDGSRFLIEGSPKNIIFKGRPMRVMAVRDITERKKTEKLVRDSEARLAGIIEAAMDAIVTVNESYQVVTFNHAAEVMFGCAANEVLGQSLDRFLPERFREEHRTSVAEYGKTGISNHSRNSGEPLYGLRANGQEFPVEATLSLAKVDGEKYYTVFVRDVTERVEARRLLEEQVAQRTQELSVLLEISQTVAADLQLPSVKGLLVEQLRKLMKCNAFNLYSYDSKADALSWIDGTTGFNQEVLERMAPKLNVSSYHAEAIRSKKPLIIGDLATNIPSALAKAIEALKVDLTYHRSFLYVPLVIKEEVVGLFVLSYHEPNYYTAYHAQLAQAIGQQVAIAIENVRLYEQGQRMATLEERQRLARELHDSTSQVLYSIQLGVRALQNFLQKGQLVEVDQTASYLLSLAKGGLDEMRALLYDLRPEALTKEGLVGGLRKQLSALETRYGLQVEVRFSSEDEPDLPQEYKENLYRIAREALHNIVKHANTNRIHLEMTWTSQKVELVIQDFGKGFDPTTKNLGHLGLQTMQERIAKLPGGKFLLESRPGNGTKIRVLLPIPNSALN